MKTIILTAYFLDTLDKFKFSKDKLLEKLKSYPDNCSSLINLWKYEDFIVFKDYLKWKKIRMLTLLKTWDYYIPFVFVAKNMKKWNNIDN